MFDVLKTLTIEYWAEEIKTEIMFPIINPNQWESILGVMLDEKESHQKFEIFFRDQEQ